MLKSLAIAATATLFATTASAVPATPEAVEALLASMNTTDIVSETIDDTIVRIDGTRQGYNFTVRLMDCTEGTNCVSSMIFATFNMDTRPQLADFTSVNEYNDSYPFGRAFLIGDTETDGFLVGVDYAVSLSDENALGTDEVNLFFVILNSFVGHMQETDW
jgi:hypothetical protein